VPHDTRDEIVDFIDYWAKKTNIPVDRITKWSGLRRPRFYDWVKRYGSANEHNGRIPRDFWLLDWEKEAIIRFHSQNPLNGYRRLTFMMLDQDIVAVSPKTTYRVLKEAGVLDKKNQKTSQKGTGFKQPLGPHMHWHIDISYINICGTFYYLCSVLDGFSRYIVHWEIKEAMKENDVELVLQRAREKHSTASPRIISDNGPQFTSREFKNFIRLTGMDHVKTSPYYPQSNGKIERWHRELKEQCIRPKSIETLEEAIERTTGFVHEYNNERLHAALGYITPKDKLEGHDAAIFASRDRKLETARAARSMERKKLKMSVIVSIPDSTGDVSKESEDLRLCDSCENQAAISKMVASVG
jgi:putative transposase